ncbi:MAG: hypothetical protein ACK4RT_02365 [Erythrobacter sp.]
MVSSDATRTRFGWMSAALVAGLAAFPVIGSLVSAQFQWNAADVVLWAVMLGLLAGALMLVARLARSRAGLLLGLIAAVLGFLMVWAELAVGIFD